MPALTLEFAKVDVQLGLLRRRLNLRRLLDAVCLSGALAATALSVLISLALRATPAMFSYALWATILLTAAATAFAMALVRSNWISLTQTAHIADQEAQLEDRLSTLITHQPSTENPSRMAAVLLSQVLSVAQRWEPRTLVPVRIPRSTYICAAACALLTATALLERQQPDKPADPPSQAAPTPNIEKSAANAVAQLHHPEDDHNTAQDHTRRKSDTTTNAASGVAASSEAEGSGADKLGNEGAPSSPGASGTAHSDATSNKIQTLIRQALGAAPLASPDRASTSPDQKEENGAKAASQDHSAERRAGQTNGDNGLGQEQSESNAGDRKPSSPDRDSQGPDRNMVGNEDRKQRGSGSGAGGTAGAAPFGPPGTADSQNNAGSGLRTFTIKLTESSRVVYTTMEGQTGQTGEQMSNAATSTVLPQEQSLRSQSSEQRGLHRSTIPTEHEATVRRIFSRQADGE